MNRIRLSGPLILGLTLSALPPPPAILAGEIHPDLGARLASLPAGETTEAFYYLREQAPVVHLARAARERAATRSESHREVVSLLRNTAERSQSSFLAEAERWRQRDQVEAIHSYWIANLVRIRGTRTALERLAAHPDIDAVEAPPEIVLIEPVRVIPSPVFKEAEEKRTTPGIRAIRADRCWYELGINGEGTLVACLDTGVDWIHPALRDRWRGNFADPAECWFDNGQFPAPWDGNGHGTSVMGTIAGLGAETADTVGVAWGARWIAAAGLTAGGDVTASFQFFADPDGDPNTSADVPDVVQNSWGVSQGDGYTDCDSRWWQVMDNCEAAGVVLVFSAGNSGPEPRTILSPADRADSPTNSFSVGAIDATYNEWPYPIALFSSIGPSRCPGEATKPEVVAPGLDVYTAGPLQGGGYRIVSGTSLSGPHVAGAVALIRQLSPDLSPDEVKTILMETARNPNGGEDNSYGWGVIDAYAAVLAAAGDRGRINGQVFYAGDPDRGVAGVQVQVTGTGISWTSFENGRFGGFVPAGTWDLIASHPLLEERSWEGFSVGPGTVVELDLELADRTAPRVTSLHYVPAAMTQPDSTRIVALLEDFTGVESVILHHRTGTDTWNDRPLDLLDPGAAEAWLPTGAFGETVEFYLAAVDPLGNAVSDPVDGAAGPYAFELRRAALLDDGEEDRGWVFGAPEDDGIGAWVRMDPFGSREEFTGRLLEPEDDHTPGRARSCFVTGRGKVDVDPDRADVDGGCVSLLSPVLDLTRIQDAMLSYWRWFALAGDPADGSFSAEISGDGGLTWSRLERLETSSSQWIPAAWSLEGHLGQRDSVRIRFVACDDGDDSIVEAAIDDIALYGTPAPGPEPSGPPRTGAWPNPSRAETAIRFSLPAPQEVSVLVFDPVGRRLRVLDAGILTAGWQEVIWDGKDASGRLVPSGIYLYQIRARDLRDEGRLVRLR